MFVHIVLDVPLALILKPFFTKVGMSFEPDEAM
jgi:hypothetical protein